MYDNIQDHKNKMQLQYEGDIYNLAVQANVDEDTYAPMDLFDWLDVIGILKLDGKTLKEIGTHLSWDESKVKQYSALISKVTNVLGLCKNYQHGRVTGEVTSGNFNFTERWFRDSGLYDITSDYQLKLFEAFKVDKFNWNIPDHKNKMSCNAPVKIKNSIRITK